MHLTSVVNETENVYARWLYALTLRVAMVLVEIVGYAKCMHSVKVSRINSLPD